MKVVIKSFNSKYFKILLFFLIFFLSFPIFKSFIYFRAYNLISDTILLITDEGFIFTDKDNQDPKNIYQTELFSSSDDLQYISFTQADYDNGNLLFCRIKEKIYILSYDLNSIFLVLTINDMAESEVSLITFQDKDNNNLLIVGYINTNKEVILEVYNILDDGKELKYKISTKIEQMK